MASSAAAEAERGRSVLDDLLRAIGARPHDLADRLLREFGSLGGVLAASPEAQRRVAGDPGVLAFLAHLREALAEALRPDTLGRPIVSDAASLCDYLRVRLAAVPAEELWALFLDASNHLIREEVMARGSVTAAPVCAQTILRRALELNASALIVVHNHPSGDPSPSAADVRSTRTLASAADALGLALHDHLIITRSRCTSLRQSGFFR